MPTLSIERSHKSYEDLEEGVSDLQHLLDTAERNQKSGIYLRNNSQESFNDELNISSHPHPVITTQLQADPFKAEKQLILDSRQSAPSVVHKNFVSRTRSLSPTRRITLRVISRLAGRGSSILDHPVTERYHRNNVRTYDPLLSGHQKLQRFDETREIVGKDIKRKITESHRDLATLKNLITDTFGEHDDSSHYRYLSGTDHSYAGLKFDPEVYLDTLERRRRHSLDYSYSVEHLTPIVSTPLTTNPNTFYKSHHTTRQSNTPKNTEDSTVVIKITEDKSIEPRIQTISEMHPIEHLARFPRLRYNYLYNSPRFYSDHYLHTPRTYIPRYYHDDSLISYNILPHYLDSASAKSLIIRPEPSYFSVDKTKHNQLVRSTLPNLYHWHGRRGHSVLPHWKPSIFSGTSYTPRYHYVADRNLIVPTHLTSGLSDEEQLKLEKYEIQSLYTPTPSIYPYRHHHHDTHFDTEPLHFNFSGDDLHRYDRYNKLDAENLFHVPRRFSRNLRPLIASTPATTRRHFRTRSLPPIHHWNHHYFPCKKSLAVHPITSSFETKSFAPPGNLETVDKIMNELGDSNDVPSSRSYGTKYYSMVPRAGHTGYLRPPSSYEFYRQIYKKHLSAAPPEVIHADYQNEIPSISVYRTENHYGHASNTIYQDGQFFQNQIYMNGKILTPPTRVTKPEDYIRRGASGEYAKVISKHDFESRYSFQRFSVI